MTRKRNHISQTEARRLRAENERLRRERDRQRNRWASDFPGGTNIATITYSDSRDFVPAVIANSRLLGHAVICTTDGATVRFYALQLPEKPA